MHLLIHPQSKYLHTPSKYIPYIHTQKLEVYRANQDQIRNQRPRLRRNTLILGRKAGGFSPVVP